MSNDQNRSEPLVPHDSARHNFNASETRQGGLGRPVFIVLIASIVLALMAWAAVELWAQLTEEEQQPGATQTEPAAKPVS